jgi:riboflavin kinase/FMN adenylyltransferase
VRVSLDPRALPPPAERGAVASIGVFDGVHLGHQAILAANLARSRELDASPTVVTFAGHPKRLLLGHEPRTLTSLEHRLELFRRAGIEHTLVLTFDEELRELSAEEFIERFLVRGLGARAFVLGFDSKFGHARRGTPAFLRERGFDVAVVEQVVVGERAVSSTAIREAVELGDLEGAQRMLGRAVSVLGTVVHGDHLGGQLGFPTANLDLHHELHPPPGVYYGWARGVPPADQAPDAVELRRPAVANIGFRPTVGGSASERARVEVHLLDFDGELYGSSLEVTFVGRLRAEQRFASLTELRAQIGRDVAAARERLKV